MMPTRIRLTSSQYTVGWLCAVAEFELTAARKMLDRRHLEPLDLHGSDRNAYVYGDIHGHNTVITCLPPGQPGIVSAQKLVQPLRQSFPNLDIHLFVGIGGGIPRKPTPTNPVKDIHLGDVIVGWPDKTGAPVVIPYNFERRQDEGKTELLGSLDKPDRQTINALNIMLSDRETDEADFSHNLRRLVGYDKFQHPGLERDVLFQPNYLHIPVEANDIDCSRCDRTYLSDRPARQDTTPQFHQGTILSGDAIVQSARMRDEVSDKYNAVCFEMEAAGVMDDTHCLVIRGISDYADGHKPSTWRYYAAATAAAFARELLGIIRPGSKAHTPGAETPEQEMQGSQANSAQDLTDEINDLLKSGEHSMNATDFYHALNRFEQARARLSQHDNIDPALALKVYFRLMTVEMDITHDKEMKLEEQRIHIRLAEEHGAKARRFALGTTRAGAMAQVRLERTFVKGRKAELEELLGANDRNVRDSKGDARRDIEEAMDELQLLDHKKSTGYEARVATWQERLSSH